ncbi:DUF2793 domain-containing protein [Cereibacter sp. SYSU M97828]|nr:DUF2793 domain-containing protein [Cereibacter flavus]
MSSLSPALSLPFLEPAQAQKHVTHNEALRLLDVLVQPVVKDRTLRTPPAAPSEGDRHIVAAGATGDWAGRDGRIAVRVEQHWEFIAPQPGWKAHLLAEGANATWTGTVWATPAEQDLRAQRLGVSATPDDVNRLAVAAPATLLNHAGAGHQLKVNKAAAADTASLLFQNGHSGRAEMGIVGGDNFTVKVSADGNSFATAMTIDRTSAQVSLAHGLNVTGPIGGTAVQSGPTDAAADRLMRVGAFGLGGLTPMIGDAGTTANSIAPGFYHLDTSKGSTGGPAGVTFATLIHLRRAVGGGETQMAVVQAPENLAGQIQTRARGSGGWSAWRVMWDKASTTVDANGFLKQASPILRLFDDATEEPVQPTGATVRRGGPGHHELHGTLGLARSGWQIEVPRDHNGNILVHVATRWQDGVLHIDVSAPVWVDGRVEAGAPAPIPEGRWIDIRLHEEPAVDALTV